MPIVEVSGAQPQVGAAIPTPARKTPPPLPKAKLLAPPPLPPEPPAYLAPVQAAPIEPARFQPQSQWDSERDLPTMFDGAARRRRVAWVIAVVALLAVAAAAAASVLSQFRPR